MSTVRILGFGAVAIMASMPAVAAPAVFEFATGAEGWIAAAGVGLTTLGTSAGAITFDYIAPTGPFDPILQSPPGLAIDASTEHWLRVDVEITTLAAAPDQLFQVFYDDGTGLNEGHSRTFAVTPNAGVQSIVLDMATIQPGRTDYSGTISMFRVDPGTSQADLMGGSGRVELIALTDNADMDGLVDDVEIAVFGDTTTSTGDTDTDSDGINDKTEIAFGLDPFTDEGIDLPLGGAVATLLALGLIGVWRSRK